MTDGDRSARARRAALLRWARADSKLGLAPARKAFADRFREQAAASAPGLTDNEIEARARRLMRAHFTQLAIRSAAERRRKRSGRRPDPHTREEDQ